MKVHNLIKKIFITILILTSFKLFAQNDEGWQLSSSKNGIKVYTRKTEGHAIKEFKAVTKTTISAEEVCDLILNPETYPDWMASVKEAHLIKKEDSLYYIYSRVDVPWPFDDRDQVSTTKVIRDTVNNTILCDIKILKDYGEEKKGLVRITDGYGYWLLKNDENGGCNIIFQFYADPGGSLPKGIVNMFIESSPYKTMMSLKKMK